MCRRTVWWNCASIVLPFTTLIPPVLHRTDWGHTILFYLQGKHVGGKVTRQESALLQVEAVLERTRVTYVPSQFEDYWTATASKGRILEKARAQLEFSPNRKPYRKPSESVANMMSRFTHHIGNQTQWGSMIEPLTGVGRHPLFILQKTKKLMCRQPTGGNFGKKRQSTRGVPRLATRNQPGN